MESNFEVVTTFHEAGYHKYGKTMIETFGKYWPKDVKLTVYFENMDEPKVYFDNVEYKDFNFHVGQRYEKFKELAAPYEDKVLGPNGEDPRSHREGPVTPGSRYLFEATRFSHKYFAIDHHRKWFQNSRYLIWCDADVVATKDIPINFLESIVEEGKLWTRIGRPSVYPECGFMIWDNNNEWKDRYFQLMEWLYDQGALFQLEEWHDSYVWWAAEKYIEQEANGSVSVDIGDGSSRHPFVTGPLGKYLDHLKGKRKDQGYSPERNT